MSCAEKYDVWEKLLDSTVRFMEIEYFFYAARYSFIIHNMCNQEPTKILFISEEAMNYILMKIFHL